jgi:cytochrome c peroxidase
LSRTLSNRANKPVRSPAGATWLVAAICGGLAVHAADLPPRTGTPPVSMLALPKGFPKPEIPPGNPLTAPKVQLGRYLFYDKRMSVNGTSSCATCHRQELAFTDGRAQAVGATGQTHPRSAMSLVNLAYNGAFNWSNPNVHSLEEQALKPMFSTDPVELGVVKRDLLRLIRSDPVYRVLFPRAFPGEANVYSIANVTKALASFERTIVSGGSPYDRFHLAGESDAIPEAAKRGEILFFLDYGGPACFRCHGGFNFSDAVVFMPVNVRAVVNRTRPPAEFHNTGLYNVAGPFSYPLPNAGLYEHTKNPADVGKFKAPTLRNIALSAPYMHDGSIATLAEVVDHYAAGGRTIGHGPWAGVGRDNPAKDKLVHGFPMTPQNRADLVAFLESLTDDGVTHDPRFADPWPR